MNQKAHEIFASLSEDLIFSTCFRNLADFQSEDRIQFIREAAEILAQYLLDHESSIRDALAGNNLHDARVQVNGGVKNSFNAVRQYVGETIITDPMAVAKQKCRVKIHAKRKPKCCEETHLDIDNHGLPLPETLK